MRYRPDQRQGEVHGLFVELHDITHHKRIEDLVLEANRDLEERVQERTAQLIEARYGLLGRLLMWRSRRASRKPGAAGQVGIRVSVAG